MIDYTDLRKEIEVYLQTELPSIDFVFENTIQNPKKEVHVETSISDINSKKMGMTESVYLVYGLLSFEIQTKQGSGTETARSLASQIVSKLIVNENIEIVTENPEFRSGEAVEDTNFYTNYLDLGFKYFYGQ